MRRLLLAWCAALLALSVPLGAAGTVTVTKTAPGCDAAIDVDQLTNLTCSGGIVKYTIAWTSTAGGAVSGNSFAVRRGYLVGVKFVPASGGTQPSDLYDVTLVDTDGIDLLDGTGANVSNVASGRLSFDPALVHDATQSLDLVVANAGAAKQGTVILWVLAS